MKNLDVPYLTQLNNVHDPFGACNITCIAMCLAYRGIVGDGSHPQLEDQVWHRSQEINANRFEPQGIRKIVESYGKTDVLSLNGNLETIRRSIDGNNPVIVHGYATEPGHIIVIKGYDRNNCFNIHDPYGEAHFWKKPWRYDLNTADRMRGKELRYSEKAIAACCSAWSLEQAQNYYFSSSFNPEAAEAMWVHSIQP